MKIKIAIMCSTLVFSPSLLAGSLDSPAAPTDAGSAMFTLEDIYNRLNDGTAGDNVTGSSLSMTIPDGFYSGSKTATASDTDLTAANIKSGVEIFGVSGDTNVVDTSSGDAIAVDIKRLG